MTRKRTSHAKAAARPRPPATIAEFLAGLDHSLKPVLVDVVAAIRWPTPVVRDGIKWNAPSFLEWLGAERAVVRFGMRAEVRAKRTALQAMVLGWLTQLSK